MSDTFLIQRGERGHVALWQHIMNVSNPDLKKNYERHKKQPEKVVIPV